MTNVFRHEQQTARVEIELEHFFFFLQSFESSVMLFNDSLAVTLRRYWLSLRQRQPRSLTPLLLARGSHKTKLNSLQTDFTQL
jgi:hypothetical protein